MTRDGTRIHEQDVMRKYKLCHAHLDREEAVIKICANLMVIGAWSFFALLKRH